MRTVDVSNAAKSIGGSREDIAARIGVCLERLDAWQAGTKTLRGRAARFRRHIPAVAVALTLFAIPACTDMVCTMELDIYLSPRDTTIAVGESFVPVVRLSTCGGREQVYEPVTWHSDDPAVASVELVFGLIEIIEGQGAGETNVRVIGDRLFELGAVRVVVEAR